MDESIIDHQLHWTRHCNLGWLLGAYRTQLLRGHEQRAHGPVELTSIVASTLLNAPPPSCLDRTSKTALLGPQKLSRPEVG